LLSRSIPGEGGWGCAQDAAPSASMTKTIQNFRTVDN
jgi:hypothetical protein